MNSDFQWQCWYFFLYQQSNLRNDADLDADDGSNLITETGDLILESAPTKKVELLSDGEEVESELIQTVESELIQTDSQILKEADQNNLRNSPLIQPMTANQIHRLLDCLVKRTSHTTLENLEHLASILTALAIQTGKLDVESLMYELN